MNKAEEEYSCNRKFNIIMHALILNQILYSYHIHCIHFNIHKSRDDNDITIEDDKHLNILLLDASLI